MAYQAVAKVWTPDYRYTRAFGAPQETHEAATAVIHAEADKFWPGDANPSRRASFIRNCFVEETLT